MSFDPRLIRNLGTPVVQVPGFPFPTQLVENPVNTTVLTTVTQLFKNNPDRVFWYVENRSAVPMFLAFNQAPGVSSGKLFDASGGWVSMQRTEDGDPTGWGVFAMAQGANGAIYSFEINRIAESDR